MTTSGASDCGENRLEGRQNWPTTFMMSLEPYPTFAGAASALSGTLQFACGAISGSIVSALFNGTALPLAAVVAGCAVSGLICAFLRRPEPMPSS